MESPGKWLEKALTELCRGVKALDLDADVISGLVTYCELGEPLDAKEYLDNIVGEQIGKNVTEEYLRRRGYVIRDDNASTSKPSSSFHTYIKPRVDDGPIMTTKKPQKAPKEAAPSKVQDNRVKNETPEPQSSQNNNSKKKKSGKTISLAEASKGTIVYQKGKPCSCQARRHNLVSNCLSCGKIVCEQEGEGPCSFCGSLVLKEGSSYAGLSDGGAILTDAEVAAEAFAKRLVEYDRDSAARTTVIDDQSDYYEIESNTWLSKEEKSLLLKKQAQDKAIEEAIRSKVVMSFDMLGRKVLLNDDEASEEMRNSILLQPIEEREDIRVKPNPSLKVRPIFIDPGDRRVSKDKKFMRRQNKSLCLEISGRVQSFGRPLDAL